MQHIERILSQIRATSHACGKLELRKHYASELDVYQAMNVVGSIRETP